VLIRRRSARGAGYLIEAAASAQCSWCLFISLCGRSPGGLTACRPPGRAKLRLSTSSGRYVTRPEEAHIRALLVQALAKDDFILRAVRSRDLSPDGDLVEVGAELHRYGRDDLALEQAVSRLSLEPSVSSVSWTVADSSAALAEAAIHR